MQGNCLVLLHLKRPTQQSKYSKTPIYHAPIFSFPLRGKSGFYCTTKSKPTNLSLTVVEVRLYHVDQITSFLGEYFLCYLVRFFIMFLDERHLLCRQTLDRQCNGQTHRDVDRRASYGQRRTPVH